MSIALKTALIRLARGVTYAVVLFVIQWAVASLAAFHVPDAFLPFATAGLMALDKWWREHFKPDVDLPCDAGYNYQPHLPRGMVKK